MSNKHKKRIDRKFTNIAEELEYHKSELKDFKATIYTVLASSVFVIFCVVVLFDQIVGKVFFPYIKISQGLGAAQITIAVICLVVIYKLCKMVK